MVSLDQIQSAHANIRDAICVSPCRHSHALTKLNGAAVSLKLENLQRTGAFKERGALNKLLTLTPEERTRKIVAASAGNHAQAIAYHSAQRGLKAEIWMPLTTPLVKVASTRNYGAEAILHGTNFDETFHAAKAHCQEKHCVFVHPFDDEAVIAGQGTIALELLEQAPDVELVIVPVGGGGLISGIAVALKELNPRIQVCGVQAASVPSMKAALQAGKPVEVPASSTLADGIGVRRAGESTFRIVEKYVDDIIVVDEEEIAAAVLFLLEREKTLAEGAGAVAVAAVLHRKLPVMGKHAVAIVSGGNMDVMLLSRIIERGLVKDGRLIRLRISLPDHPGSLHRLTNVIADHRINIVESSYHRVFHGARIGHTLIDLTMEARDLGHSQELSSALSAAGYTYEQIV